MTDRPALAALLLARRIQDQILHLRQKYGLPHRPAEDAARSARHDRLIYDASVATIPTVDLRCLRISAIDAAIDALGDHESPAAALARLIDAADAWHWRRGFDRGAVVESSGAWWCVVVAGGTPASTRHATRNDAASRLDAVCGDLCRGAGL